MNWRFKQAYTLLLNDWHVDYTYSNQGTLEFMLCNGPFYQCFIIQGEV